MQKEYNESEHLSFKDESNQEQHGLRGVVQIYRRNKETGEVSFWDESHNIIPISGYNVILMKLFGLFLDSSHGKVTDNLTRDTNLAIPDLNEKLKIGVKPEKYTVMDENIASNYICQGFMIGNGGANEDSITTKNTAYSFVSLRNPIPFQQDLNISPTIAAKYLGIYHGTETNTSGNLVPQSAYIKKFDEKPHIYHSWWVDGQRWDYIDPVTQEYLGPDSENGSPKTNRIETYVECKLSLSNTDCQQYFKHVGNTQTAMINELGLVAFDVVPGKRNTLEEIYNTALLPLFELLSKWYKKYSSHTLGITPYTTYTENGNKENTTQYVPIKEFAQLITFLYEIKGFILDNDEYISILRADERLNRAFYGNGTTADEGRWAISHWISEIIGNANKTKDEMVDIIENTYTDAESYATTCQMLFSNSQGSGSELTSDSFESVFSNLTSPDGLNLMAYYNQDNTFMYLTDDYSTILQNIDMSDLTLDEAQRIKLITYYTFNSIPISENWEILINYRIYAN